MESKKLFGAVRTATLAAICTTGLVVGAGCKSGDESGAKSCSAKAGEKSCSSEKSCTGQKSCSGDKSCSQKSCSAAK